MTTRPLKEKFILCFAVVFMVSPILGCQESDEHILRREFGLSSSVKPLSIKSYPEKPVSWVAKGLISPPHFSSRLPNLKKYLINT